MIQKLRVDFSLSTLTDVYNSVNKVLVSKHVQYLIPFIMSVFVLTGTKWFQPHHIGKVNSYCSNLQKTIIQNSKVKTDTISINLKSYFQTSTEHMS